MAKTGICIRSSARPASLRKRISLFYRSHYQNWKGKYCFHSTGKEKSFANHNDLICGFRVDEKRMVISLILFRCAKHSILPRKTGTWEKRVPSSYSQNFIAQSHKMQYLSPFFFFRRFSFQIKTIDFWTSSLFFLKSKY